MTLSVILSFVLQGILLPAVVAGLVFLGLRFVAKDIAAPIAIAAGFFAGFFGISGLGGYAFPPRSVQHWLPHVTLAALALGLVEYYFLKNIIGRWALRLILIELLLWQIFQPFINHPFESRRWTGAETFSNLALTTAIIVIFWVGLDYLLSKKREANRDNAILPTALVLIATGSSLSVVISHSLVMGQLSGALTASLGAIMVLYWIIKTESLPQSVTPLVTLLLALPWLSLYTKLPVLAVVLLALSPWFLIVLFEKRSLLQRSLFRLGLTAIPIVIATIIAAVLS